MEPHPPFTLQHLRILLAVASLRSVTRAAAALGLTQPAVSQGLRELERRLGADLLERPAFDLTDEGRAFLPGAREVLDAAERASEALAGGSAALAGTLSIGASTTLGNYLLPLRLGAFTAQHPRLDLQLLVGNTADVCDRVARREVDVGFIEGRCTRPELDVATFGNDELLLVAPLGHPLLAHSEVPLAALNQHPLILREPGSGTREVIERTLLAAGVSVRCTLCLGHTEAIKTAVAGGLGVSILSRLTLERELAAGVLGARSIQDVRLERPLFRVELRGRARREAVRRLVAALGAGDTPAPAG